MGGVLDADLIDVLCRRHSKPLVHGSAHVFVAASTGLNEGRCTKTEDVRRLHCAARGNEPLRRAGVDLAGNIRDAVHKCQQKLFDAGQRSMRGLELLRDVDRAFEPCRAEIVQLWQRFVGSEIAASNTVAIPRA